MRFSLRAFSISLILCLPMAAWAADTDGDGIQDNVDKLRLQRRRGPASFFFQRAKRYGASAQLRGNYRLTSRAASGLTFLISAASFFTR